MDTSRMSTTDRSAAIRSALKAKGITSRQVSIRTQYFSGGSSISIHVKDPNITIASVEELANEHENIHRDQFGEILSGGNRYVSVTYAHSALAALRDRYLEAVKATAANVSAHEPNRLYPVPGTGFYIGGTPCNLSVWDDSRLRGQYLTIEGAAETIGVLSVQ